MKTYVIGLATYREIIRRPLFWLVVGVAAVLQWLFSLLPYFTFGEDIKMVAFQGLAAIMVPGLIIGFFAASVSIADEIDGKTAITLLSKPIQRRNFIIGKYLGIMAAVGLLFLLLGANFMLVLFVKLGMESIEVQKQYLPYVQRIPFLLQILPAIVLYYFQVAILCALSVAFSTRLPVHLNVTACLLIFLLGNIAPVVVQAGSQGQFEGVQFMAEFFAAILPGLDYFNVERAIAAESNVPWLAYVLPCLVYTILYTGLALVLALLFFEDRDLA